MKSRWRVGWRNVVVKRDVGDSERKCDFKHR